MSSLQAFLVIRMPQITDAPNFSFLYGLTANHLEVQSGAFGSGEFESTLPSQFHISLVTGAAQRLTTNTPYFKTQLLYEKAS